MKFTHLLCFYQSPSNLSSLSRPPKWKIPEKKKWFNINFEIPETTPKQLFWRMVTLPYRSYFVWIGGIAVAGGLGFMFQYYHAQYSLRTSDYTIKALNTLLKYPHLTDLLGCPLKVGHVFPTVKDGIQSDEVRVRLPITGEKSNGILFIHAIKDQNIWIIRSMQFKFTDRAGGIVRLIKDPTEDE